MRTWKPGRVGELTTGREPGFRQFQSIQRQQRFGRQIEPLAVLGMLDLHLEHDEQAEAAILFLSIPTKLQFARALASIAAANCRLMLLNTVTTCVAAEPKADGAQNCKQSEPSPMTTTANATAR